ncbi:hypothetical protein [Mongoliibacter ruber]|uniref:WG repeat protein n=1 Tax=Mongoliibacter ruber TaxID=1750599 RepID=A0A2T0WPT2_9BACT|nr:hypothetical protein [Mongoliibacter ruber]PRY88534.1 hypothetical protein CLW00_104185 [Mongoliibacter ruber]
MKRKLALVLLICFGFSCSDPGEPIIEEDPEDFELYDSNIINSNGFILGMEIIDEKLFFLHVNTPGYINKEGIINFTCCLRSGLSNRFRPSFTEDYIIHPVENLSGFFLFPNFFGDLRGLNFAQHLGEDGIGATLVLDTHKNFFHPERNFDLNGNHLILNLAKDGVNRIIILEIDFGNGFGSIGVNKIAEINPSNLGMDTDSNGQGLIIQSVKKLEDQWVAHIKKAGDDEESGDSFLIYKDGSVQKLIGPSTGSPNFRFYDYAMITPLEFLISESPIGRISYSNSIISESKEYITEVNGPLIIRSDGNKGLIFIPGTNILSSLDNFRENGVANHQLQELDRTGLESPNIYDVQFFGNKAYVATRDGLFVKSQENFWEEVRLP